jgi:exopolysaccharide biosynthesis predicted pyruvyltransferase EpsI
MSTLTQQDLRAQLRERAFAVLSDLLEPGTPCALVDFPHHANVGDSAIWLGERALLRRARVSVAYTCDLKSFSAQELTDRLPTGTILIHGGGNLGDLWPAHQEFRERIIRTFSGHRIIQLPQSIHFNRLANLDRARTVLNAHPDLVLCVRDRRSLDRAREAFQTRCVLSPDMAFGIEEMPGTVDPPRYDVVWQTRADHESARQPLPPLPDSVLVTDWAAREGADPDWTASERAAEHAYQTAAGDHAARAAASDHLAALHLSRGCRLLASGQVVITDRLHGHVLSLLLGLPHVYLGDRYGKLANCRESWTSGWPAARWARTPDEALAHALDLVAARRGQG